MTTPTTGFDARQPRLPDPRDAVAHLAPETWERANRLLVRKALAEFAHERLITPEPGPDGLFSVTSDDGGVEYRFAARVMSLEHWRIEADSIVRRDLRRDGAHLPLDALDLILDLRAQSQGLAFFAWSFDHLQELTGRLADRVVEHHDAAVG